MRLDFITSAAKAKIFELLVRFNAPLCLRDISSLTGIGLRSTQIALADFQKLKVLRMHRESNRAMYSIIDSSIIKSYRALFDEEVRQRIKTRAERHAKKAMATIPILQDLQNMSSVIDQIKSNQ